jgi:hypothetical protein
MIKTTTSLWFQTAVGLSVGIMSRTETNWPNVYVEPWDEENRSFSEPACMYQTVNVDIGPVLLNCHPMVIREVKDDSQDSIEAKMTDLFAQLSQKITELSQGFSFLVSRPIRSHFGDYGIIDCCYLPFNGVTVRLATVRSIGFPERSFVALDALFGGKTIAEVPA